ncbi:MAG: tetratricopeptide repeat protein [Sphingomonadaceae bacterium]|nr:tetratricopeptide repeat protein [Sphingomonadaceae bacterium]
MPPRWAGPRSPDRAVQRSFTGDWQGKGVEKAGPSAKQPPTVILKAYPLALRPPSDSPPPKPGSKEAAQQDVFLREVDDALREEQVLNTFKRYGKPVGAAVAAALLALGGYLYWDHTDKLAKAGYSERLVMALDRIEAGQIAEAERDLEAIAKEAKDGPRAVALMQLAAIAAQKGDTAGAAKRFADIAADKDVPQVYRDLATVREVTIRFDTMKPEEVVTKLKPIAVPGNAYFGSAGELLGMAYLEMGKPQDAGKLFAEIGKDEKVPGTLRARMRQLAGGLGFDAGIEDPELASEGESASQAAAEPAASDAAK